MNKRTIYGGVLTMKKFLILLFLVVIVACSTSETGGDLGNQSSSGSSSSGGQDVILTINSPTASQSITSNVVVCIGTASAASGIKAVYLSVTNGPFHKAAGTENWQTNITLDDNAYTIRAYAEDNNGKVSSTNSVNFSVDTSGGVNIDLTTLETSTVTNVSFVIPENSYNLPFEVSTIIWFDHKWDDPNNTDGTPLKTFQSNVYMTVVNFTNDKTNSITWSGSETNHIDYFFQGEGATEDWSYDSDNGWYLFVIDKTKIKYAIDKIAVVSVFRGEMWGGDTGADFGIGANCMPQQSGAYGSYGIKTLDQYQSVYGINYTLWWCHLFDWSRQGLVNMGYKKYPHKLHIYLKGSLITSKLITDSETGSSNPNVLWAPVVIFLGK